MGPPVKETGMSIIMFRGGKVWRVGGGVAVGR